MGKLENLIEKYNRYLSKGENLNGVKLSQHSLQDLNLRNRFTFEDVCYFQQLKSIAVVEGKLAVEDGQLVYKLLGGENVDLDTINNLPLGTRVILMTLFCKLSLSLKG